MRPPRTAEKRKVRVVTYDLEFISGLRMSDRRCVVLLASDGDDEVDAAPVFHSLDEEQQRTLRYRFDQWIDNVQHNKHWSHGFDQEGYRECFVFKWKHKNMGHRLYGFLCHPLLRTNRRFYLCVLTNHDKKPLMQWETKIENLDTANRLRVTPHVLAAISMKFPDQPPGTTQCH